MNPDAISHKQQELRSKLTKLYNISSSNIIYQNMTEMLIQDANTLMVKVNASVALICYLCNMGYEYECDKDEDELCAIHQIQDLIDKCDSIYREIIGY